MPSLACYSQQVGNLKSTTSVMLNGDQMVSWAHWEALKVALKRAKSEGTGLVMLSSGEPHVEISRIESWQESYGNFVVWESENRIVMFNANDILMIEIVGKLVLHLKIGVVPPLSGHG